MQKNTLLAILTVFFFLTACEGNGGVVTSDPEHTPHSQNLSGSSASSAAISAVDTLTIASSDRIRVYDGDTFTHYGKEGTVKVRLYGIDAPEKSQTYGVRSTNALQTYLSGKNFTVYIDSYDKYGRALGKIYVGDTYINLEMIRTGNAWWYQYFAPKEAAMEQAFNEAQHNKRGLWSLPNPQNPYDFRKEN